MKIAVAVQGRFHAFDLIRALLRRGHDLTVFTNYPRWAVKRFALEGADVRSFWPHGVVARIDSWLDGKLAHPDLEPVLHTAFGRWVAREIRGGRWDVIHTWSGVSEEVLRVSGAARLRTLMRGSAHILAQARLLEDEERRTGVRMDRPSAWMIDREQREYAAADRIVVLSTFARETFVAAGVRPGKLWLLPLAARTDQFGADDDALAERCRRIRSGQRLRVLFVGTLCYRKGFWDCAQILRKAKNRFEFRFVGPVAPEVGPLVPELAGLAEFVPKQPQHRLRDIYSWGDLFLFPTIEDGFAAVLAQAQANGLPLLTTTNCSGPDLIRNGAAGWVMAPRCPEGFLNRLNWCDEHREELVQLVSKQHRSQEGRTWENVAGDFELLLRSVLEGHPS